MIEAYKGGYKLTNKTEEENKPFYEIVFTPSDKKHEKEGFFIYEGNTWDENIQMNSRGMMSVKGKMQELTLGVEYKAKVKLDKVDPTYGASYWVDWVYQDIPNNMENQRYYLQSMMTENQVKALYVRHGNEDILELFKQDKIDYRNIYGWAEKSYKKIRKKILDSMDLRDMFVYLGKYGIKHDTVKKLIKEFGSAQKAISEINKDVYALTRVPGIGFKTADAIAMGMGMKADNPGRIKAAIRHVLKENEISGDTYATIEDLIQKTRELLNIHFKPIAEQVSMVEKTVMFDGNIALKQTYYAEHNISVKLKDMAERSRVLDFSMAEFLFRMEKKYKDSFPSGLTDEQKQFFYNVRDHSVNVLAGSAGCVDAETEFFNGEQWKKISEYREGDRVLQYNADGSATLVYPEAYIKKPESKMTLIQTKTGSVNQCLSDEHNIIYRTSKNNIGSLPFVEVKRRHTENEQGFNGKFYNTFTYSGEGVSLTNEEIRVMVAVIADGYFPPRKRIENEKHCNVHLKKQRKIDRFKILLKNANIIFKENPQSNGYTTICFDAPIKEKVFNSYWYKCNKEQLQVIAEEVLHWDGRETGNRSSFNTSQKQSADFIQFVFTSIGRRTTILKQDRRGQIYKSSNGKDGYIRKSVEYTVVPSKNNHFTSIYNTKGSPKASMIEIVPEDGFKYCFTMPSGMWVMRRGDRICVTGNSGKTAMQKLIVELIEELKASAKYLCPTGKASKVLSKYIGKDAHTIHRAIGFGMDKEDKAQHELWEDFLIVDETSMLDVFLTSAFLDQIKNPHSRIIFIGDPAQAAAVSAGNVLNDMVSSGIIKYVELTKVWRQKEGGILDIATRTRQGIRFLDNNDTGKNKFGENLVIHCISSDHMESGYKYYYNYFLQKYQPEEIMVLSSTNKNNLGTVRINGELQKINNPLNGQKQIAIGEDAFLRVGDYVINKKNNYSAISVSGEVFTVVNGDTGKIIDIVQDWKPDPNSIIDEDEQVDLNGIHVDFSFAVIVIPFEQKHQLVHSWALSIHASQGSSAKAVIVVADKAHKFQLTRNLLYVASSRATEREVILTQAETINFAMKKVDTLTRKTLLDKFLRDEIQGENVIYSAEDDFKEDLEVEF